MKVILKVLVILKLLLKEMPLLLLILNILKTHREKDNWSKIGVLALYDFCKIQSPLIITIKFTLRYPKHNYN